MVNVDELKSKGKEAGERAAAWGKNVYQKLSDDLDRVEFLKVRLLVRHVHWRSLASAYSYTSQHNARCPSWPSQKVEETTHAPKVCAWHICDKRELPLETSGGV
jgi:hypothetical protein